MRMKHYPTPDQKATLTRTRDEIGRYKWTFTYDSESKTIEELNNLIPAEVKTEEVKKYSEKELYAMNLSEQTALIKKYNSTVQIPNSEKNRVKLILKLQE